MEIRGATVHGSKDFERQPPGHGFFFAGRLWNQPALEEMSLFSGTKISLTPGTAQRKEHPERRREWIDCLCAAFARRGMESLSRNSSFAMKCPRSNS